MIPADILTMLFIALALAVFFVIAIALLRWMASILVRRAELRRRMAEPETHGDAGGMPLPSEPGDEFYAKRRAGDKI